MNLKNKKLIITGASTVGVIAVIGITTGIVLGTKSSSTTNINVADFANKLKLIEPVDLATNIAATLNKSETLPSELVKNTGNIDDNKIKLLIEKTKITEKDLNEFEIAFSNAVIDDEKGTINFDVKLSLKADPLVNKTFANLSITGLQTKTKVKSDLEMELAKIDKLELKSESILVNSLPSEVMNTSLNDTNLQPKTGTENYVIENNYTITYALATTTPTNDNKGTLKVIMTIAKEQNSLTKEFEIFGFTKKTNNSPKDDSSSSSNAAENKTIIELTTNSKLKTKLPSEVKVSDLTLENLVVKDSKEDYTSANGYNLTFSLTGDASSYDVDGAIFIKVIISKNGVNETKTLLVKGLENKLNLLTSAKINTNLVTGTNKATIFASNLLKSDGTINASMLNFSTTDNSITVDEFQRYNKEFTLLYVNDVNGKLGFNVKLTSESDSSVTKTFKNLEIIGLKPYSIDRNLTASDFVFKTGKNTVTVNDLKTKLAAATDKVTEFKNYFDVTTTNDLNFIAVESLEPVPSKAKEGTLTYKLSKNNVKKGSLTNPSEVATVTSNNKTVVINKFMNAGDLIDAQLAEITSIVLTSSSTLKNKLPSKVVDSDLTSSNIDVKKTDGENYVIPEGYGLTYQLVTNGVAADDTDGSIFVKVIISKDGVSKSKVLSLSGLQKTG